MFNNVDKTLILQQNFKDLKTFEYHLIKTLLLTFNT